MKPGIDEFFRGRDGVWGVGIEYTACHKPRQTREVLTHDNLSRTYMSVYSRDAYDGMLPYTASTWCCLATVLLASL